MALEFNEASPAIDLTPTGAKGRLVATLDTLAPSTLRPRRIIVYGSVWIEKDN